MMKEMLRTLRPLPLFVGLKPKQMQSLLGICKVEDFAADQALCEYGAPSHRLFVLVKGKLEVLAENGDLLATIAPVNAVGEVGFITRKPRSATVKAQEASRALVFEYYAFDSLVERDPDLRSGIYRNVIRWMAEKLCDANDLIVRYRRLYEPSASPAPAAPSAGTAPDENAEAGQVIGIFYKLTNQNPEPQQLAGDQLLYAAMKKGGRSREDILYAVKWTARYRPAAKQFSAVKTNLKEAFESRWSV